MLRLLSSQRVHTSVSRLTERLSTSGSPKCFTQHHSACSTCFQRRDLGTSTSSILKDIQQYTTEHPVSVFASTTNNPYHNLAIENYILKHSEPNSSILFTYVNRPCIVFGRNQNPWLEINIARAQQGLPWNAADWQDYRTAYTSEEGEITPAQDGKAVALDLVRRRSGGGTVIHDAGNLNFSFIVPNDKDFTRNKHARLIIAALQSYLEGPGSQSAYYGRDDIYVNERHDIAMKLDGQALKVSGSAFKLTKGRALHHGTLLLASPNIAPRSAADYKRGQSIFSKLLSSPAKPFLDAKGVGSVSSPVHNLFDLDKSSKVEDTTTKRRHLVRDVKAVIMETFMSTRCGNDTVDIIPLGDDAVHGKSSIDTIREDVGEMMTDAWRYGQTPSFLYKFSHQETTINFQAKQSKISEAKLDTDRVSENEARLFSAIDGKLLHEIKSWDDFIPSQLSDRSKILEHLSRTFPNTHSMGAHQSDTQITENIAQEERVKSEGRRVSLSGSRVVRHAPDRAEVEIEEGDSNTVVQK